MWNQGKDVLVEALWPTLELATGDPESEVYLCDNGARWYTVNSFKGCALQNVCNFVSICALFVCLHNIIDTDFHMYVFGSPTCRENPSPTGESRTRPKVTRA